MNFIDKIDWESLYSAGLYVMKNYPLKILGNIILGLIISSLLITLYLYFLKKTGGFKRENRWYNKMVKLYFPAVIIITIFFGIKIGIIRGIYKGLQKDSYSISKTIYDSGAAQIFSSEKEKQEAIVKIQSLAKELQNNNKELKINMVDLAKQYNSHYTIIDQPKNWIAKQFVEKYGDQIQTLVIYGTLNAAPHVNISENISYKEFDTIMQQLRSLDPEDVEKSIIAKIQDFFLQLLTSQYHSFIKAALILLVALLSIPWIELLIYTLFRNKKLKKIENAQ